MKNIMLFLSILVMAPLILFAQTATPPTLGDGSIGNPYQISTLDNLYWISQNNGTWSSNFIQTTDIDASATSVWDGGAGWTPIYEFTGTYDGNGYTISNLNIQRPSTAYIGLFRLIASGGQVKKLGVTNVNISGNLCVGGLAGVNNGTIENCFASGTVTGSNYVGGLVGSNSITGVIRGSYSRVNVVGSECVGSLTGENYNGGSIQNSYATGSVTGSGAVGGLTGSNYLGSVSHSYSTGSSSGGGLIGFGGGTCTDSFWDTNTSGNISSAGGTGTSTTDMQTPSTFTDAGWDFTTVWVMIGTNYPSLINAPDPSLPVELVSFTAAVRPGAVTLNWQTATEKNNYGFEIERKEVRVSGLEFAVPDGRHGEQYTNPETQNSNQAWVRVGFVEGSGTTNAPKSYSYVDESATGNVVYRLKQIDRDGKFEYSQEVEVMITQTPKLFALMQNYPNPFNPTTTIAFSIPKANNVTLKIFDAIGREVATLVNGVRSAGEYNVEFNASTLASGMYLYRLQAGSFVETKKFVLMK
jgi:hypothetical protein